MHMQSKIIIPAQFALITPSYRNDLELATDLCNSIDRYVTGDYEHIMIVPQRDLALFKALESPHRRVISEKQLLRGYGLFSLPLPTRISLPFMRPFKFRQQWWCRGVGRISGWVTQQLIKLSAVKLTSAPFLVFIDSDVVLIRSLDLRTLLAPSGASYLQQAPMRPELTRHQRWYSAARKLFAIGDKSSRAAVVKALHAHLDALHHEPWQRAIARTRDFSEYILYGVYASEVHRSADAHVFQPSELTCSVWVSKCALVAEAIADVMSPNSVALHLQSTLPLSVNERRKLCQQVIENRATNIAAGSLPLGRERLVAS